MKKDFTMEIKITRQASSSFKPHIQLLQLCGSWSYADVHTQAKLFGYDCWQCFALGLFLILYIILEFLTMYQVWGNLEDMISASFLIVTHFQESAKLYCLLKNRVKVVNLVKDLDQEMFQPKNQIQQGFVKEAVDDVNFQRRLAVSMCLATCVLYGIFAFIDNSEQGRKLPFIIWYPFETSKTPIYEILFTYEILCVAINAIHVACIDLLVVGLMKHACAQVLILRNCLENLTVLESSDSRKKDLIVSNKFEGCIKHHTEISRFVKEIETIFTNGLLAQLVAGVLILCITGIHLTIVGPTSLQFYAQLLYLACMLYEILLYCYYGNEIIYCSRDLPDAIYDSKWYEYNSALKRDMRFFMFCTNKPLAVRAGNFFVLSLNMYMMILRHSYSYFALLQSVR